jgi:hypothetical protein
MAGVLSSEGHFNDKRPNGSQKMLFCHPIGCPLVGGTTVVCTGQANSYGNDTSIGKNLDSGWELSFTKGFLAANLATGRTTVMPDYVCKEICYITIT